MGQTTNRIKKDRQDWNNATNLVWEQLIREAVTKRCFITLDWVQNEQKKFKKLLTQTLSITISK